MKKVKFYFELTSKGKLQQVKFFPEGSQISISILPDAEKKIWKSEEVELIVDNPFQYELVVFGTSFTKWDAELKIVNNNGQNDFLSWSGITGDSANNVSRRNKPEKNID